MGMRLSQSDKAADAPEANQMRCTSGYRHGYPVQQIAQGRLYQVSREVDRLAFAGIAGCPRIAIMFLNKV